MRNRILQQLKNGYAVLMMVTAAGFMAGASNAGGDPTDGWTQQELKFKVQRPYDVPESERYKVDGDGVHHLWVFNTDKPFSKGNTTLPRTEMRFPDYSSGQVQFEADMMAPSGTDNVCIMQIHTSDAESHKFGSTTFMLDVRGDSLKHYGDKVLAPKMLDKWFHLNVIHNLDDHTITAFIDKKQVWTHKDNGAKAYYFKCGVYEQKGGSDEMQVYVKNVKLWKMD
jgi:hypothetical protein